MMYCKDRVFHDYRITKTKFLRRELYLCKNCNEFLTTEQYREWFKKKLRFVDVLNERRNNLDCWGC